ncbi:MSCRAMM family protein, partial [Anabaenopsis elenkinii]
WSESILPSVGTGEDVPQATNSDNITSRNVLPSEGGSGESRTTPTVPPPTKPENFPSDYDPSKPISQDLARLQLLGLSPTRNTNAPEDILPVGIKFNRYDILFGVLVKGREDGTQALDFEQWLIPYESIIEAFGFTVTPLPNGNVQLRSPGLVKEFDPKLLIADINLGDALSIAEIRRQFPLEVRFDIDSYAIVFEGSWLLKKGSQTNKERPVILEGLPRVTPPEYTIAGVSQNVNSSLTRNNTLRNSGSTTISAKLGDFTFQTRIAQPDLANFDGAYLQDLRVQNLNTTQDHIFGNQSLFYPGASNSGEFWGYSYVHRFGYQSQRGGSGRDLNLRLNNRDFIRTIQGKAPQGSLVQIWGAGVLLDEVLVDQTQRYTFPNVQGNKFTILSYPNGNLATTPQRETRVIEPLYQQLPAGSSAIFSSVGTWRQRQPDQPLGSFDGLVTGVGYRYGVSNDVTVGVGGVYDRAQIRGFAEIFYTHPHSPLTFTLRGLSGNAKETSSFSFDGSWKFTDNFNMAWSGNTQGFWRMNTSIEPIKNIRLQMSLSDRGFNFKTSSNLSLFGASANLALGYEDTNNLNRAFAETSVSWRWGNISHNFDSRFESDGGRRLRSTWKWNNWELGLTNSYRQFTSSSFNVQDSQVWKNLTFPVNSQGSFHDIYLVNNLTRHKDSAVKDQIYARYLQSDDHSLFVAAWRHDGNSLRTQQQLDRTNWSWELGYGFGSSSSGALVSVTSPNLFAGLSLRGSYSGASVQGTGSNFSVGLVWNLNLNLQDGITTDKKNASQFEAAGGILVQPFYDQNNNGVRDRNEAIITENYRPLLMLNNRSLKEATNLSLMGNGIIIPAPPGTHRLDLDPAGYPIEWEPEQKAYAVEVAPGAYTIVKVPFIQTATVQGILRNQLGNPVNGARIEAINTTTQKRYFSITSPSGIFFLENLPLGEYKLNVGDFNITPNILQLQDPELIPNNLQLQVFIPRSGQTARGEEVPTYTVSGYLKDKAQEDLKGIKVMAVHGESGKTFTSITDIQGFFQFPELIPGEYQIKVGDFIVEPGKFIIDSSSPWENQINLQVNALKQELYAAANNYIVRGLLRDETGEKLSEVNVILTEVETNQKSLSQTNSLGAFTIENMPMGKYRIEVEKGTEKLETSPQYLEINDDSLLESTVNIQVNLNRPIAGL